jgi:hypothetical protein
MFERILERIQKIIRRKLLFKSKRYGEAKESTLRIGGSRDTKYSFL